MNNKTKYDFLKIAWHPKSGVKKPKTGKTAFSAILTTLLEKTLFGVFSHFAEKNGDNLQVSLNRVIVANRG